MIYLASPYSHTNPDDREAKFQAVCKKAAELMRFGYHIFSPIAHTHPIAEAGDLPKGWDYWEAYDREFIGACSEVWVLMLDGWEDSEGVRAEIRLAGELGKPIRYLEETSGE